MAVKPTDRVLRWQARRVAQRVGVERSALLLVCIQGERRRALGALCRLLKRPLAPPVNC